MGNAFGSAEQFNAAREEMELRDTPPAPRRNASADLLVLRHAKLSSEACDALRKRFVEEMVIRELDMSEVSLLTHVAANRLLEGLACSHLERISIAALKKVDYARVVAAIGAGCPTLTKLSLAAADDDPGNAVCAALVVPPSLRSLRLASIGITDAGVTMLCATLRDGAASLKKLVLSGNDLSDDGVAELAALLPAALPALVHLDVANNNITTLAPLFPVALQLQTLCVHGNNYLTFAGLAALPLPRGALRKLNLSNLAQLGHSAPLLTLIVMHLDWLDVSKSRIGDTGALCIASALRDRGSRMRTLNVSLNGISAAGVEALTDALASNTRLRLLNVGLNESQGCGEHVGRMLARNAHLEVLSCKGSRFSPQDIAAIARGLSVNRALLELTLYGNRADYHIDEFYGSLAGALRTNRCLKRLKISREDKIGHVQEPSAAAHMIRALSEYGNVSVLEIQGCSYDDVLRSLLERNQAVCRLVARSVITLLCVRKYHAQSCGGLGAVAAPVVALIARHLYNTRGDASVWLARPADTVRALTLLLY